MTIINFSRKFVFVHVPRTAGTSFGGVLTKYTRYCDLEVGGTSYEDAIGSYYLRFGLGKHSTAAELTNLIGGNVWGDMFTFAFVRHPITRTYSIYRFLKFVYREWSESSLMDAFPNFESFLRSKFFSTEGPDRILNPQCFWLGSKGEFLVKKIGRLENLDIDMRDIILRIDPGHAQALKVARENASPPGDPTELTETALTIIGNRYQEDFRRLGYKFSLDSSLLRKVE